ncbi:MAG: hypothetical protein J0H85_17645 [Sediminibacterium magnilacihabitans]|jgi:Methylamine utilisation protein MauE|nr:hypothetical protein [Sediminibacterium magnilacihabitans]
MQKIFIKIIVLLLVVLYTYTACSKWFDFTRFKEAMLHQPLADWIAWPLIYTLPVLELAIALGLLSDRFRKAALLGSSCLLAVFTAYAALILLGGFNRIPCSCGAVISGMGWKAHLVFNTSFLILNAYGVHLLKKLDAYHQ